MRRLLTHSFSLISCLSLCQCALRSDRGGPVAYPLIENGTPEKSFEIKTRWARVHRALYQRNRLLEKRDETTLKQFEQCFGTRDPETQDHVRINLLKMEHLMSSGECKITCFTEEETPHRLKKLLGSKAQKVAAYAFVYGSPRMYINPDILETRSPNGEAVILHEISHIAGGTQDYGYNDKLTLDSGYFLKDGSVSLTPKELKNNADTYARFVFPQLYR